MAGKRYKKAPKSGKAKKVFINIILFCFIQLFIAAAYSMPMVYYGPFETLRDMLVTTAMTTLHHQYIATAFLSKEEIDKIMAKDKIDYEDKKSDAAAIAVSAPKVENTEDAVKLINISTDKMKGYVVLVKNPAMVSVAVTNNLGKKGMLLEDIVKENNAFGGINAGGFVDAGGHGNGGIPTGLLMKDGNVLYGTDGVKYPIIGFNESSVMVLGSYTIKEAKENKIKDAVSFGPFLIVNGDPLIKGDSNGGWGLQPRTAIGQAKDGTIIMVVIDGRQFGYSDGATLRTVQDIMLKYGAYNAANLDGGSSTTLVYDGKLTNKPCSSAGPRYLPSAFIIKK